jgi:hypothetical protein
MFGKFRETIMKVLKAEGLTTRLYQTHPVYKQLIFQKIFDGEEYPWKFNNEYMDLYKENYSNYSHVQTLNVIDNTFAIGNKSSAPFYFMQDEVIDLYIQGFEKIKENINQIVGYCNNEEEYHSPYEGIARLSDTNGKFI